MKIKIFVNILIIFVIISQTTCADPAGMVLLKNLTSTAAYGVFNLGKYSEDGYITVKSLIGQANLLLVYHNVYDGQGVYESINFNMTNIPAYTSQNITLLASTQDYFLAVGMNKIPKYAIQVKNANGDVLKSIEQYAYGDLDKFVRKITFKNDCTISMDRRLIQAPYLSDSHIVKMMIFSDITSNPPVFTFVQLDAASPTGSLQAKAGQVAMVQVIFLGANVDVSIFSYGIPLYSPLDKKCQIEQSYSCSVTSLAGCKIFNGEKCGGANNLTCITACGDNIVDYGEQCDGNAGCGSNCKLLCGNGILDAGEECDNKKKAGCLNCKVQSPYKCKNPVGKPSLCFICGNSIFQQGEECDNGNKTGCVNCTLDRGFTCKRKLNTVSNCTNICGDGLLVVGEECDNGNQTGCINCVISAGYTCRGPPYTTSKCIQCGNFIVEWPQQCDNNNANGCQACKIQSGWNCRANPKYCYRITQVCGNGEREIEEDCDDGNKVNGDGCSSLCKKETGYTCSVALGEKTTCSLATQL